MTDQPPDRVVVDLRPATETACPGCLPTVDAEVAPDGAVTVRIGHSAGCEPVAMWLVDLHDHTDQTDHHPEGDPRP